MILDYLFNLLEPQVPSLRTGDYNNNPEYCQEDYLFSLLDKDLASVTKL